MIPDWVEALSQGDGWLLLAGLGALVLGSLLLWTR